MNKRTKRILSSLLVVSVVATAAGFGTRAFFTDTETSTGNVLQAGAIDLKVGNTSYYYDGVVKLADQLSWSVSDLTIERFFDLPTLGDLKPGDWGEDTVELTVTSNPAWVCADIQITANGENVLTDPEAGSEDVTADVGELGKYLNFVFWADDGDNVWECLPSGYEGIVPSNMVMVNALSRYCERPLLNGTPSNLGTEKVTYAIADSSKDGVWATPLAPETSYFIGKYWCFGNVTPNPVDWSDDPERSPLQGASGFNCTVPYLGWANDAQTDSITADISFTAVQSRHNEEFRCNPVKVEGRTFDGWPANQNSYGVKKWEAEARAGDISPDNPSRTWEVGVGTNTAGGTQDNNQAPDADYDWINNVPTPFTLVYDNVSGLATFSVTGAPVQSYNVGANVGSKVWIAVKGNGSNVGTVSSMLVNGNPLADMVSTGGVVKSVEVLGLDASTGFTLSGNLTFDFVSGAKNSDFGLKVEVSN